MRFAIVTLMLICGLSALAQAQQRTSTGDRLHADCKEALAVTNEVGFQTSAHCLGMVQGVRDTLTYWSWANEDEKRTPNGEACIPQKLNVFDVTRTVVKYLDAHTAEWNDPDTLLILRALRTAYPCK